MSGIGIREATSTVDLDSVRTLFLEYATALGYGVCFEGIDAEMAGLPGAYAPPGGRLWLAVDGAGAALGCVALRPLADGSGGEMKRLFLRPAARGTGLGRRLARQVIDGARAAGYRRLRLDTLPQMEAAIALYRSLGFVEIPPWRTLPVPGALFFELEL